MLCPDKIEVSDRGRFNWRDGAACTAADVEAGAGRPAAIAGAYGFYGDDSADDFDAGVEPDWAGADTVHCA